MTKINSKSEISNVCNAVESHCFQVMKIVRHHANGRFDWLISGRQSVNPSREAISILSGKHKRFTFVHPVSYALIETADHQNSNMATTKSIVSVLVNGRFRVKRRLACFKTNVKFKTWKINIK